MVTKSRFLQEILVNNPPDILFIDLRRRSLYFIIRRGSCLVNLRWRMSLVYNSTIRSLGQLTLLHNFNDTCLVQDPEETLPTGCCAASGNRGEECESHSALITSTLVTSEAAIKNGNKTSFWMSCGRCSARQGSGEALSQKPLSVTRLLAAFKEVTAVIL